MGTTYSDLLIDIQNWVKNNSSEFKDIVPRLIGLGQEYLEDILRIPAMETAPNLPTMFIPSGGRSIAVPTSYVEMIYFSLTDQIPSPVNITFTQGAGILADNTYYYRVSALNSDGETLASAETSLVVTGGGGVAGVNVNWTKVTGATGYKIYGRSTGAEQLIATVGDVATYLDDGTITPSGALPTENTTGRLQYPPLERYSPRKSADLELIAIVGSPGRPDTFKREGDNFILDCYTDQVYVYKWSYYQRLATLSTSVQTNWWTDNAHEALLYSSLVAAVPFLGDDPRSDIWISARNDAVKRVFRNAQKEMSSGASQRHSSVNIFPRSRII